MPDHPWAERDVLDASQRLLDRSNELASFSLVLGGLERAKE
jgi:hypothetical protein